MRGKDTILGFIISIGLSLAFVYMVVHLIEEESIEGFNKFKQMPT